MSNNYKCYTNEHVKSDFWQQGNVVKITTKGLPLIDEDGNFCQNLPNKLIGTIQQVSVFYSDNKFDSLRFIIMNDQYQINNIILRSEEYFKHPEQFGCELIQAACLKNMTRFYGPEDYKLWKVGNKVKLKEYVTDLELMLSDPLKYQEKFENPEFFPMPEYKNIIGVITDISIAKNWLNQVEDVQVTLKLDKSNEEKTIMVERSDYIFPEQNGIILIKERKEIKND